MQKMNFNITIIDHEGANVTVTDSEFAEIKNYIENEHKKKKSTKKSQSVQVIFKIIPIEDSGFDSSILVEAGLLKPSQLTQLKNIHKKMRYKCYNPDCKDYKYYGARNIRVCDKWLGDPHAFAFWAVKNGFDENLTLDRIDNDGDYSPENCRWADRKVQANNRSNNVIACIDGQRMTATQIAEAHNLNESTVRWRIKRGWSSEEIILPPGSRR